MGWDFVRRGPMEWPKRDTALLIFFDIIIMASYWTK
jgi:hypothetical protein